MLPIGLRESLPSHDVHSAAYAGMAGISNGEMIRRAIEASFDVIVTAERGIPHQPHRRVPCVHMERVGIRRLRERLSEYVGRAEAGERIEITDRGRTVARLEPPPNPEHPLDALIADGLARAPVIKDGLNGFQLPSGPITTAGSDALEELREDRV